MKDVFELAGLLIGVATVALLIGNAQKTAVVIQAGTSGFNELLRTVTLQNQFGNVSNLPLLGAAMTEPLRSIAQYPGAGLAVGTGLTFTRVPKPWQVSEIFPYPNLRWGLNLSMPVTRNIYGGGQKQMLFGRYGGFDTVSPLRKSRNGSNF